MSGERKECKARRPIKTLAGIYQQRGPSSKFTLLKNLLWLSLMETSGLQEFINELTEMLEKLKEEIYIPEDILTITYAAIGFGPKV